MNKAGIWWMRPVRHHGQCTGVRSCVHCPSASTLVASGGNLAKAVSYLLVALLAMMATVFTSPLSRLTNASTFLPLTLFLFHATTRSVELS